MITLEEAIRRLKSRVRPLPTEEIAVLKSYGRVLGEDIRSPLAVPPFHKSAMDGYAVKAADITEATAGDPALLRVIGDIPAGKVGGFQLKKGTAARIMTGAPLPRGADTIVMVEDTEIVPEGVLIKKSADKGNHVARKGEDIKKGECVLRRGSTIGAAEMGVIASTGRSRVQVSRRPRVRIVSTGSEILKPGAKHAPGHIYDANGYSLTGLATRWGAEARFLGIARDTKGALERKIARAENADLLVLSGGVSVGDYDLVQDILLGLGIERIFYKTRMKPGKPTFAGISGQRLVLGLPGHPVSCMVTFILFAGFAIDLMLGRRDPGIRHGQAILTEGIRLKPDRRKFLRGTLQESDGQLAVKPFHAQQSSVLQGMVAADVLIDAPDGVTHLAEGSLVDIVYW